MSLEPGTRLGPYEVIAPIGDGSERTVQGFRYAPQSYRRHSKLLPPEFSEHPGLKERLERDSRAISSLKHPQICALVDVVIRILRPISS